MGCCENAPTRSIAGSCANGSSRCTALISLRSRLTCRRCANSSKAGALIGNKRIMKTNDIPQPYHPDEILAMLAVVRDRRGAIGTTRTATLSKASASVMNNTRRY